MTTLLNIANCTFCDFIYIFSFPVPERSGLAPPPAADQLPTAVFSTVCVQQD